MKSELLRKEIDKKGIKLKSIADRLSITPVGLKNKMNGKSRFYVDEAYTILEILGKEKNDIQIFFD